MGTRFLAGTLQWRTLRTKTSIGQGFAALERGVATGYSTAESWDATDDDDKAILWKTSVPGLGHSSPIVVGDRVFLATAVSAAGEAPLQVGRGGNTAAADDNWT